MKGIRRHFSAIRWVGALGLVFALGLRSPAYAGVSVAGAINPIPTSTTLGVGDIIDVTLAVTNTSQTTPPDPFGFLPATLMPGTTIVFEACQDSGCSVELAGTLAFVDGGGGNG